MPVSTRRCAATRGRPPPALTHVRRAQATEHLLLLPGSPSEPWSKHRAWRKKPDARLEATNADGAHMMSSRSPIARLRGGRLSLLAAGSEHMRLASEATRHFADQN